MEELNWPNDVYILIPSYKEANGLKIFLPDLLKKVPSQYILVVDDASGDNTKEICLKYNIDYTVHTFNKGKGAALRTGFSRLLAKGADWILSMDADGQHSPEDINKFLDARIKYPKAGIIIGARDMRIGKMPPARIFSNKSTSKLLSLLCNRTIKDSQCGYRLYSSALLNNTETYYNRFQMESEIILQSCFSGFPVFFVEVQTLYCSTISHISHLKDTIRWLIAVFTVRFKIAFKKQKKR